MVAYAAGPVKRLKLILILKVWLIILLCDRRTKQRFIMSRSFQMKNVYQSINHRRTGVQPCVNGDTSFQWEVL